MDIGTNLHKPYEVGGLVAQNSRYELYHCTDKEKRDLLLQVSTETKHNSALSRSAWILKRLAKQAIEIQAECTAAGGGCLNYELCFPEVHDSFTHLRSNNPPLQANILGFRNVPSVRSIIPVIKIWKESLRVDLRTSAWMMGKLLKLLVFTHDHRVQIGDNKISGNNVLIEPDEHYIIIFDWSEATIHENKVPSKIRRAEIAAAAKVITKALGNDLERAQENKEDAILTNYLKQLAAGGESIAAKAHKTFYSLVDSLCDNPNSVWERGFYKFATYQRR